MVKASAKTTSCLGDASSIPAKVNLFVWICLLMVWLLQGGFTVHRTCLEGGHMH